MVFVAIKKFLQNTGKYHVSATLSEISKTPEGPANFEDAIAATGYGKFNFILSLLALAGCWSNFFSMSSIPYIIPDINCDLKLSLFETGILNASPFAGMICSAFLWGYLADTYGRRKVIIYGSLADVIVTLFCGFAHSIWMLIIFKFFNGFIVNGPYAALMTYIPECHSTKYRSQSIVFTGIFIGAVSVILPSLGLVITPIPDFSIFNMTIYSWQIYILICGIPSLVAGLTFIPMPESPKYLLMNQKYDEALRVFQMIFKMNTGKPARLYPIQDLKKSGDVEKSTPTKKSTYEVIVEGFNQIKPIFYPPHLWKLLIVTTMQFMTLCGSNTLRSWQPLIFTYMDNYEKEFGYNNSAAICDIIDYGINNPTNNTNQENDSCLASSDSKIYINLIIVGACGMLLFTIVSYSVNKFSVSSILSVIYITAVGSAIGLIWSNSEILILTLSTIYISQAAVAVVTMFILVVDAFPTEFRTMSISLTMMCGRIGAVIGNLIFPTLLETGCYPPFVLLAVAIFVCIPLQVLFVFLTKNKPIDDEK